MSRSALTGARNGDRAKRCAMPRRELTRSRQRQIAYFGRNACPSTTEGVLARFSSPPSPEWAVRAYIRGCFFRVEPETVHVNETGTSEVGIAVTAKAPPARKARGVTSSDNAESVRAIGTTQAVDRRLPSFEPPKARPPKQATVNRRAHVFVGFRQRELHWISSALHHPA